MSCCRTCTTLQERSTNAVQQSICRTVCDVESMDFNTAFDGRKCDHTTRIPLCCKTPLERTLGELPCLCSAQNPNMLVSLSVSRGVQAICAEGSTSANSDGDGDDREKARTADGGTFARLCVRGMRKVCRAQLEKILDVQRRSDTTFPIHAVHSTCMYSNATSASAQLIRAACMQQLSMQHDCATCASMLRDAVTAAQSRFLATVPFSERSVSDFGRAGLEYPRRSRTEFFVLQTEFSFSVRFDQSQEVCSVADSLHRDVQEHYREVESLLATRPLLMELAGPSRSPTERLANY